MGQRVDGAEQILAETLQALFQLADDLSKAGAEETAEADVEKLRQDIRHAGATLWEHMVVVTGCRHPNKARTGIDPTAPTPASGPPADRRRQTE